MPLFFLSFLVDLLSPLSLPQYKMSLHKGWVGVETFWTRDYLSPPQKKSKRRSECLCGCVLRRRFCCVRDGAEGLSHLRVIWALSALSTAAANESEEFI